MAPRAGQPLDHVTTLGESERRERGPRCISPAELPALLSEVAPAARSSMQGWRRAEPLARGEPRCAAALYLPRPHHRLVSICVCRLRVSQNDFAHGLIGVIAELPGYRVYDKPSGTCIAKLGHSIVRGHIGCNYSYI